MTPDLLQSVHPWYLSETQLAGVTSLCLSHMLAFGDTTPLLCEPQGPAAALSVSSSPFSAFHPLPSNGEQATTGRYRGCTLGIKNMVSLFFVSSSQFIFEEWDWLSVFHAVWHWGFGKVFGLGNPQLTRKSLSHLMWVVVIEGLDPGREGSPGDARWDQRHSGIRARTGDPLEGRHSQANGKAPRLPETPLEGETGCDSEGNMVGHHSAK